MIAGFLQHVFGLVVTIFGGMVTLFGYLSRRKAQAICLVVDLVQLEERGGKLFVRTEVNLFAPAAVRVYNDSNFEIVISEVGVRVQEPTVTDLVPAQMRTLEREPLPHRLSPKTACVIGLSDLTPWDLARRGIVTVYARTDSGREFKINRGELSTLNFIHKTIKKNKDRPGREIVG